jgi:hypothetical protein
MCHSLYWENPHTNFNVVLTPKPNQSSVFLKSETESKTRLLGNIEPNLIFALCTGLNRFLLLHSDIKTVKVLCFTVACMTTMSYVSRFLIPLWRISISLRFEVNRSHNEGFQSKRHLLRRQLCWSLNLQ